MTRRLEEAGAVLIGKTNLHEFAMGGTSATSYFGQVRNPLAARPESRRLVGRIGRGGLGRLMLRRTGNRYRRHPHPRRLLRHRRVEADLWPGLIRGIIPLNLSLDHCGPVTRTVEDAALLLNELAVTTSWTLPAWSTPGRIKRRP